jgi:hypothetical protein
MHAKPAHQSSQIIYIINKNLKESTNGIQHRPRQLHGNTNPTQKLVAAQLHTKFNAIFGT